MNKRRTIRRVVGNFQKFSGLFILRIAKDDRDVEISQTEFFGFGFLFGCPMLARGTQVDDGLNAFVLKLLQMFQSRLAAGAELFVDSQKIPDGRSLLLRCDWERR